MAVVVNPGLDQSGVIGHQGRIHPGRSANPSQGTHTHTLDYLEMPIPTYHACLWTGGGNQSTQRKPLRHRENMQTPHTRRRRESNPQPWRYEANVLTTKPPKIYLGAVCGHSEIYRRHL
ncbi:hypothetical protein QTP70_019233 [Hemibagrus guttatus]|uniref:Uncharacterized protein n=1 Tax=Hemibagrus guttatus TaxID=175788 RepID=A0AAE0V6V7_9TELE|nr:hypothetical protein QTP70_019233 [Hemibagrus guttatus]